MTLNERVTPFYELPDLRITRVSCTKKARDHSRAFPSQVQAHVLFDVGRGRSAERPTPGLFRTPIRRPPRALSRAPDSWLVSDAYSASASGAQ